VLVLRRTLVLAALLFWQGGFTFYGAVVVHVGQDVLGSHTLQGFVTRRVTNYLNLAGALALPVLAWDTAATRDGSALRRRLRWAAWGVMALALAVLVWMHPRLDALLDPATFTVLDPAAFRAWHAWYLHTSTVQWTCALAFIPLTILGWRAEDQAVLATPTTELRSTVEEVAV
jgi:hypothetical protein